MEIHEKMGYSLAEALKRRPKQNLREVYIFPGGLVNFYFHAPR